jgi:hypothetical protein
MWRAHEASPTYSSLGTNPLISCRVPEAVVCTALVVRSAPSLTAAAAAAAAARYAEGLPQLDSGRKISPNPADWRCDDTAVTENLWLNLSTGHIGSGRQVRGPVKWLQPSRGCIGQGHTAEVVKVFVSRSNVAVGSAVLCGSCRASAACCGASHWTLSACRNLSALFMPTATRFSLFAVC